jgi:MFS family permease
MRGIFVWMASSILGSLVGSKQFYLFVLSRCAFGIATASFETIALPILGDTFLNDSKGRTRAVILFNFGPPVGYGLAYLIESVAKDLWPNDWRYTLRLTPFILTESTMVKSEKGVEEILTSNENDKRGFLNDMKILLKNKTFIIITFAWTFGLASLGKLGDIIIYMT